MTFYAYLHARPDTVNTSGIFYVGKGHGKRAYEIARPNKHHANIVAKYGKENIQVSKIECSSEDVAFELEKGLIKCLRRMGVNLANRTDGGEGVTGYKRSEEWKKHHSAIMKTKPSPTKGKAMSEAQRKQISDTLLANNYWRGRKHAQESRNKMGVNKDTRVMSKDGDRVMVNIKDIDLCLKEGWKLGNTSLPLVQEKSVVGNHRKARLYITDGFQTKCIRVPMIPPIGWNFGQTRKKGIR